MLRTSYILSFLFVMLGTACTAHSQCAEVKGQSGTISHSVYVPNGNIRQQCWTIDVPENKFTKLQNFTWSMFSQSCSYAYLRISINDTNENYTFCGSDSYSKVNPITALSDIRIEFYFKEPQGYNRNPSISLQYAINDIQCVRKSSFHCSSHKCIPKSKVCDGIKDCENGMDEFDCKTGVTSVEGVAKARAQAISWLKSKGVTYWGWLENTPRAITALFLSNGANFNGTSLEEELMTKQSEVKIAIGLLKSPVLNELLSLYINSLLVTCHNPRHFYGQNLVKRLKTQVDSSSKFIHPIAYLALCNSNETWPPRAENDLLKVFNSNSEYHFVKDIQSYAIMSIACYSNNTHIRNKIDITRLLSQVKILVEKFKRSQLPDGSFGNIQTTSLVTQALISSGQEHVKNWKLNATLKFLMKELNSTENDFSAVYLTLPVFNGKSLADIFKVNCTGNPRRQGVAGDLKSEVDDYVGPKMRIQYSLFVGDEKDIIHTMSLRVPENYTAYEVMRYAEEADYKYKFEWKMISSKMYVYKIGKIINEPDVGKFWLLYSGTANSTDYEQTTSSPDQIILSDEDHLIMWYKTASI